MRSRCRDERGDEEGRIRKERRDSVRIKKEKVKERQERWREGGRR